MDNVVAAPRLTRAGILFSVTVDYRQYLCLVPAATLAILSHSKDPKLDLLITYCAFRTKIEGVARRVINAGVAGVPVVVSSIYFH
ncbi:DUF1488 family protein [Glaciimonas immobilis]|uniref:Uncharacterized protein n=1 Tax=Glaciimonas immobilis TaxID=728004 RepID=A0A840RRP1_9BURK|nr:DUF1488 domain-containing protein [Glaciimonas immobilis]MBB5199250.1 hypothetical protein [Glaciimonas immobilis]